MQTEETQMQQAFEKAQAEAQEREQKHGSSTVDLFGK